jgi:hypothetical protein
MKQKIFSVISGILLLGAIALPATAFAEENERNDPEHSITEAHEGIESAEWLAVGAGLIIAGGLAFVIGRRSGKKQ